MPHVWSLIAPHVIQWSYFCLEDRGEIEETRDQPSLKSFIRPTRLFIRNLSVIGRCSWSDWSETDLIYSISINEEITGWGYPRPMSQSPTRSWRGFSTLFCGGVSHESSGRLGTWTLWGPLWRWLLGVSGHHDSSLRTCQWMGVLVERGCQAGEETLSAWLTRGTSKAANRYQQARRTAVSGGRTTTLCGGARVWPRDCAGGVGNAGLPGLACCHHDLASDKQWKMVGWMDLCFNL